MSMNDTAAISSPGPKRRDGLVGLWGRLLHRDPQAYETWLEERDMIIITAALLRLNERQLNRIGLSRATLSLDLEDLAHHALDEAQLTDDILRIIDTDHGAKPPSAIAAE